MKIIGLSGGVASGKNFVAEILAKNDAAIFDADKEVHEILEHDEVSKTELLRHFEESFVAEKIDRKILAKIVFDNPEKLKILEAIIHPKIREKYQEFLVRNKKEILVLNIPLLLETKGYDYDYLFAIITDFEIRKQRYIDREIKKGAQDVELLKQKFLKIAANQISDEERIKKADLVINGADAEEKISGTIREFLKSRK